MARRYDFWTHGAATILQSPELAKLVKRQGDLGTVVEQEAGTHSWFHIPITTPTVLEGDEMISLRRIGLKAVVNENATVDTIHVRSGTSPGHEINGLTLTRMTIDMTFDIPDVSTGGPQAGILLCVRVTFLTGTPRGQIAFQGAGGHFS